MKPVFQRISNGSTIKTIGLPFFEKLEIVFPLIGQQSGIADVLLNWDCSIQKLESLLAVKWNHKQGLMQQLVTGRRRFKEFVKSKQQVKTRYGCFPVDWGAAHIGDHADEVSETNGGGNALPVLSCTKHRGLVN
jgi:type I restriction enzyme S subunit